MSTHGKNEILIVTHASLVGMTPLIPIPIVDDLVKAQLQRRFVKRLAASYGLVFTPEDIKILADDPERGCIRGCFVTVAVLPFKLIFRKIFFFLEWKRAIDLISRTYHYAYLLDIAFSQNRLAGDSPKTVLEVRAVIDDVCNHAPIKPIEHAVKLGLGQSKRLFKSAANLMQRSLRRLTRGSTAEEIEEMIEQVEQRESREIDGVAAALQNSLRQAPEGYFQELRNALISRLQSG